MSNKKTKYEDEVRDYRVSIWHLCGDGDDRELTYQGGFDCDRMSIAKIKTIMLENFFLEEKDESVRARGFYSIKEVYYK